MFLCTSVYFLFSGSSLAQTLHDLELTPGLTIPVQGVHYYHKYHDSAVFMLCLHSDTKDPI